MGTSGVGVAPTSSRNLKSLRDPFILWGYAENYFRTRTSFASYVRVRPSFVYALREQSAVPHAPQSGSLKRLLQSLPQGLIVLSGGDTNLGECGILIRSSIQKLRVQELANSGMGKSQTVGLS